MPDKEVKISIGGMHCAVCETTIREGLEQLPGVNSVNVSLASEKARVSFDDQLVKEADLKKVVEDLGYLYYGEMREEQAEEKRKKELASIKIALIMSAVLGSATMALTWLFELEIGDLKGLLRLSEQQSYLVLFLLATPVQIFGGYRFTPGPTDHCSTRAQTWTRSS